MKLTRSLSIAVLSIASANLALAVEIINKANFETLAKTCAPDVSPRTLAAIVKTESGFNPLAIGVNAKATLEHQATTKEEATVTAKWLIENGYNIDLGLGQVNSKNLKVTGLSIEEAFDPCKNLAAAAQILKGNYQAAAKQIPGEQAALHAALSAYNTGNFRAGFSNGYVQRVLNNAGTNGATAQKAIPIKLVTGATSTRRIAAVYAKENAKQTDQSAESSASVYGKTQQTNVFAQTQQTNVFAQR